MANEIVTNFSSGEITPETDAREDIEKYTGGCRTLQNMIPDIYGNAVRRPGTEFLVYGGCWYPPVIPDPNKIQISTPQGLQDMANDLTADYEITDNIDMTGFDWTPVGAGTGLPPESFTGSLDGNYYTVSNLEIDIASGFGFYGLFGSMDSATIENLMITDANIIETPASLTGILAGRAPDCTITQVYVSGTLAINSHQCGGLIGGGGAKGITVTRCATVVTFTGENRFTVIGGFIGNQQGSYTDCYANCTNTTAGKWDVGGFAGNGRETSSFTRCYTVGTLPSQTTDIENTNGGFDGSPSVGATFEDIFWLDTMNEKAYGGEDERQKLQLTGVDGHPSGGTYTITHDGTTTELILYDANESEVQSAFDEAFGSGKMEASFPTGWEDSRWGVVHIYIYFRGTNTRIDKNMVTADTSALTGTGAPYTATITEDNAAVYPSNVTEPSDKTDVEMKQQATFTNFDFTDVWDIDEGISYPTLRWLKIAHKKRVCVHL